MEHPTWYVLCLNYELSDELFPGVAAAGIVSLGFRNADVGPLSVIFRVDCHQYIDYNIWYLA